MIDSVAKHEGGCQGNIVSHDKDDVKEAKMAGVRQFDEGQTLDAAIALFWQQGFGSTSMQDLAAATGVLRGSLYNAYGDKQGLFLEAYRHHRERYLALTAASLEPADPAAALESLFAFVIAWITQGAPTQGCLTTKTATDETARSEPILRALRGLLDGLETLVEARLLQPDAAARLRLPAAEAARLVVTLTRGIVIMERIDHDQDTLMTTARSLISLLFAPA